MGAKKRRKQAFLAAHPRCCFCGGAAAATTEDHIPARGIFDERHWPVGYSFPACEPCNAITRDDEKIVAMLARIMPPENRTNEVQNKEMRRSMAAVRAAFPEAFEAMRLSANEVRGFLKRTGRSRTEFQAQGYQTLKQIPVISIGRPEFMKALRAFATKLFCALHYKHTGRIVPLEGEIITRFFSNVQVMDGNLPADILRVLGRAPVLTRANVDLRNQFDYEYQIETDQQFSVFLCGFRRSFAMVGFVSETDDLTEEFEEMLTEGKFRSRPFRHNTDRS